MFVKKLGLYYYTLKYLKPIQIWYRLYLRLFPVKSESIVSQGQPRLRAFPQKWKQITLPKSSIIREKPLTFSLLNQEGTIEKAVDWNDPNRDKLWLYNLHYMSVVLSDDSLNVKKRMINQWIDQNPLLQGVGWDPYPLSLRIVSWIKFSLINKEIEDSFIKSLYQQCLVLEKKIEYHLLGNHLFENAKALVFAGLFFETDDAKRWLNTGCKILESELKEQILEDGGHFERSPMYHALILEGALDLYQLSLLFPDELQSLGNQLKALLPQMIHWLDALSHPDKKIAFFNDTTFGVAPEPEELYAYAKMLGLPVPKKSDSTIYLKQSGLARIENKKALILADVGSLGPSYLPGHAHAGTLSFELSLMGERVFVNQGISTYNSCAERLHQRGTSAHNTVTVNDLNSSQVWSSFRVAKRAKVFDIQCNKSKVSASHDGYPNIIHTREWVMSEKTIQIMDSFSGKGNAKLESSFHLHPDWAVEDQENDVLNVISQKSKTKVKLKLPENSNIKVEPYDYALGFNHKVRGQCIKVTHSNQHLPHSHTVGIEW